MICRKKWAKTLNPECFPKYGRQSRVYWIKCAIRSRHYSRRTEESYLHWIRRYIYFTGKRHPAELGANEVTAFLNDLVVSRNVAASTQNQALSALLFLAFGNSSVGRVIAEPACHQDL